MGRMIDTVRLIERDGIPVEIVSGGGSGTYMTSGLVEGRIPDINGLVLAS